MLRSRRRFIFHNFKYTLSVYICVVFFPFEFFVFIAVMRRVSECGEMRLVCEYVLSGLRECCGKTVHYILRSIMVRNEVADESKISRLMVRLEKHVL